MGLLLYIEHRVVPAVGSVVHRQPVQLSEIKLQCRRLIKIRCRVGGCYPPLFGASWAGTNTWHAIER